VKSNVELTPKEFNVSFSIKRAMNEIDNGDIITAKIFLVIALRKLHEIDL
jgi:hypothetical protein